jgi:hypothetical protein
MTVTILNPPLAPQKHASIYPRRKLHLTVLTAARTIRLSHNRVDLEPGSVGGLPITDVTGTVEMEWEGDLWINGIAGNAGVSRVELDI